MTCTNNFTPEADFNPTGDFTDYPPYLCPQTMFNPNYTTGYEGMATKVMEKLLISQYSNSPNLQEYMGAFVNELDTLMDEITRVKFGRYIDNASAAQLDVIGVILQQTRNINIPKVWFGFQGASPVDGMADSALPLAGGVFRSENQEVFGTTTPLEDHTYRKVLLCRGYVLNQAVFDVNTVYSAIETALGRIPAHIKLYEDSEHNWILELDSEYTTTDEVGLLRAIQHWFVPMITSLNIRLKLLKRLVNGLPIYDVFLYNTSYDDDSGAWVNTATTQSWYTEALNTTTRGKSKKFPSVALIVVEFSKVTIYDATRSDLPMWMVFNATGYGAGHLQHQGSGFNSVYALNGKMYVGSTLGGVQEVRFINDKTWLYTGSSAWGGDSVSTIDARNTSDSYHLGTGSGLPALVSTYVQDLAVDSDGSMGNITYAATDVGLSRISPLYAISNWTDTSGSSAHNIGSVSVFNGRVYFTTDVSNDGKHVLSYDSASVLTPSNYWTDKHFSGAVAIPWSTAQLPIHFGSIASQYLKVTQDAIGSHRALTKLYPDTTNWGNSMIANITKDFNTGIQVGDIKGAFMSSTDISTLGVDETTNMVSNGEFTLNYDDWTAQNGAVLSVVGGKLRVTCATGVAAFAQQFVTGFVIGDSYKATAESFDGTVVARVDVDNGGDRPGVVDDGEYTFVAQATGITFQLFALGATSSHYAEFDNIKCTKIGNLVDNAEVNELTTGWTSGNGATLSIVGNALRITSVAAQYGYARQTFTTVIGKRYSVRADYTVDGAASGGASIRVGVTGSDGSLLTMAALTVGTYTGYFTATLTTTSFAIVNGSNVAGEYGDFDNFSIRVVDEDHSYNNKGLEVIGQIERELVNTDAELVGYSNFSEDNFLEQPYNSDLDFGTGDMYVRGWFKQSSIINYRALYSRSNTYVFNIDTGLDGYIRASGLFSLVSDTAITLDKWNFVEVKKVAGNLEMYLNDILVDTNTTTSSMTDVGAVLRLGERADVTAPYNGSMSLWHVGGTVPTKAQSTTMYEQELVMFQVGAKCTLQGSTNDVKALDYDEQRGTLKACCSYHQTTFKDLVVAEDEAAIATSVSTSDGGVLTGGTTGAYFEA